MTNKTTIDALVEALEAENAALRADNASFIVAWKAHLEVAGVSAQIAERMVNETANKLIAARAALAQARAEQAEPVGWQRRDKWVESGEWDFWRDDFDPEEELDPEWAERRPIYTTPPAAPVAKLEPLTLREIAIVTEPWAHVRSDYSIGIARAVEAAHNAKLGAAHNAKLEPLTPDELRKDNTLMSSNATMSLSLDQLSELADAVTAIHNAKLKEPK